MLSSAAGPEGRRERLRPRILPALACRETGAGTALLVVLAAVSAAAAAYEVHGAGASGTLPLLDRLFRRFDLTALAGSVVLLVFRTAAEIERDHRDRWLPALLTAGGPRREYGTAFLLTCLITPGAIFVAATVTFAVTVAVLTGSAELLRGLLPTALAGLLVLGTWSVSVVAVGITVRRASVTVGFMGVLTAAPGLLLLRYAFDEGATPPWALLLQLLSPQLFLPADGPNSARAIIYIVVVGALAAILSHRYAGRSQ